MILPAALAVILSTFLALSCCSAGEAAAPSLRRFSLLSRSSPYDPATFRASTAGNPRTWLEIFRRDTRSFVARAAQQDPQRAACFSGAWERILDELLLQGGMGLNCVVLCRLREECLRAAGFDDIFASVKQEENAEALRLLPSVLQYLDEEDLKWVAEDPAQREGPSAASERARERLRRAICGVFAGNIFDLGASASIERFEQQKEVDRSSSSSIAKGEQQAAGSPPPKGPPKGFVATSQWVRRRSLAVDDMDAFLQRALCENKKDKKNEEGNGGVPSPALRYRKVLIFVDNCGADVVCGVLPLVRDLFLAEGAADSDHGELEVVLCANERPAINDVTAGELRGLLQELVAATAAAATSESGSNSTSNSTTSDDSMMAESEGVALLAGKVSSGRLRVCSTGTDMPVIDLRRVSGALNDEATAPVVCQEGGNEGGEGEKLVILEGMGRGIETNLRARLAVDCLNLGMVKHQEVAELLGHGAQLYDSVCCFKPGTGEQVVGRGGEEEKGHEMGAARLPWRRVIGDWRDIPDGGL